MKDYSQEEAIFENFNLLKRKRAKNRFLILSVINFVTFSLSIFSMLFYQWIWVKMSRLGEQFSSVFIQMWINLLYAKRIGHSEYQTFGTISKQICLQNDASCQAIFIQFWFIGYLSFMIFMMAYILQLLDFYRIAKYLRNSSRTKSAITYQKSLQKKDSFRHIVIILCYSIGLSLDFFGLTLMKIQDYSYGTSFWVFFSSLLIFIICIIYKNMSISKITHQELILNLIEGQKNIRKQELQNQRISSSSSEFEI